MAQFWADGFWDASFWAEGFWEQAGNVPVILTTAISGGSVGVEYSFTLQATGDAPITWAVTIGVLPVGVALSAAGVFSGVPTGVESQTLTVEATNTQGSDTQELTLAIGTVSTGGTAARDGRATVGRGLLRLVGRG